MARAPWQRASLARKRFSAAGPGHPCRRFLTNAAKPLRYSQISLIRARRRYVRCREHGQFSGHRVPDGSKAFAATREGGTRVHAPRLPFPVRRDRIVDVDPGLRARRRGLAARRARGICQHPVVAAAAGNRFCAARDEPRGRCWRCCASSRRPQEPKRRTIRLRKSGTGQSGCGKPGTGEYPGGRAARRSQQAIARCRQSLSGSRR